MRSVNWLFGPLRIHTYNFKSFYTSYIAVIVVMPVNWQEKVRASTQKKAQLLRKPPLYAKNGENRGFWYSVIISVHKYGTHTDLIWLIDLHSKFRFLGKLIMIHVCDVIRLSYKKARQKLIVKENSKMVISFHFSSSNSSN